VRKVRYRRGWWEKFNGFPPNVQAEIGSFLTLACTNPYDPRLMSPSVTKLDDHARCETTLRSGFRALWTIGSYQNTEIIDLYDVLPAK
jgi:hypothetical protein